MRKTDHVGTPAELTSDEHARRVADSVRDDNLLDLVSQSLLDGLAQVFELLRLLLAGRLLVLGLLELETLLGNGDELFALELLQLRDRIFIDGVDKEKDFEAFLLEDFEEGRVFDRGEGFAGEIVDGLLDLGHASDVVLQRGLFLEALRAEESKELSELAAILRVFVDTKLDVLAKGLVKLKIGIRLLPRPSKTKADTLEKLSLSSAISVNMSMHFFIMFLRMTLRILFCWSVSREMLRGRSSESTIPLTKLRYSGMRSSQSSMMKTRRT